MTTASLFSDYYHPHCVNSFLLLCRRETAVVRWTLWRCYPFCQSTTLIVTLPASLKRTLKAIQTTGRGALTRNVKKSSAVVAHLWQVKT